MINAQRTAILAGLGAVLAAFLQLVQAGGSVTWVIVLIAIGSGLSAYVSAYVVIGLLQKTIIAGVINILASVTAGIQQGQSAAEIALTAGLVLVGVLGVLLALPSTTGTAALNRQGLLPPRQGN